MKALIVVDMQRDFMPGGSLAIRGADQLVPVINQIMEKFPLVVGTKDWHPANHMSFAANHPGKQVGDTIEVEGKKQILWPVHCVEGSDGADFAEGLHQKKFEAVFFKGTDVEVDSYSAFFDDQKKHSTGLEQFLKKREVSDVYLVGVATEYCVLHSALDALKLGFKVTVIAEGCKPYRDDKEAFLQIKEKGGKVIPQLGE